jgi:hypothetical protein
MAYSFTKMLESALKKSTAMDNQVLSEAQKILAKGYREEEVLGLLRSMRTGRIDDGEIAIIDEVIEEITGEEV